MTQDKKHTTAADERLLQGYRKMLERVRELLHPADQRAAYGLEKSIETAKEEAVALDELSQEEAERLGRYLRRDLREAGEHIARTGEELSTWLRIDLQLIEDWLLDMFSQAADKTSLELMQFEQQAKAAAEYHTGEITGVGTLQCDSCGEELHFYTVGHIPPCPKCHGSTFKRLTG